ncbi:hypothetical protein HK102_003859 [Quaeritorhiza haematococci]|nr:hypothetical protein HK102_003859 [Quaeritorhiza haematococci]
MSPPHDTQEPHLTANTVAETVAATSSDCPKSLDANTSKLESNTEHKVTEGVGDQTLVGDLDDFKNAEESSPPPPPDGGYGWWVTFASFLVHFTVFGIQYTWGIFQEYYTTQLRLASNGTTAIVGTVGVSLLFFFGIPSGRLAEMFGFKKVVGAGTLILAGGLLLASFSGELWQILLTQGALFGIGSSLCYFPAVSVPSQWFSKKRALATGIAVAGSGVGGFTLNLATQAILSRYGHGWALRFQAGLVLVLNGIACILLRTRVPPARHSKLDTSVLRDARFLLLSLTGLAGTLGYLVPLYFAVSYTTTVLNLSSRSYAALALSLFNASSAVGRVVLGFGADVFVGRTNSLLLCYVIASLSTLVMWPLVNDYGGFVAFMVINGFASGGVISLFPVVVADLYGIQRLPSMIGMLYTAFGIGNIAGAPIAGLILDKSSFLGAILWSGVTSLVALALLLAVRLMINRKLFKKL